MPRCLGMTNAENTLNKQFPINYSPVCHFEGRLCEVRNPVLVFQIRIPKSLQRFINYLLQIGADVHFNQLVILGIRVYAVA